MDRLLAMLAVFSILYAFVLGPPQHQKCAILVAGAFGVGAMLLNKCEYPDTPKVAVEAANPNEG